jgi:Fumarylacetoacetate (FAA) hydrolase family
MTLAAAALRTREQLPAASSSILRRPKGIFIMKLAGFGAMGNEKPAVLDAEGKRPTEARNVVSAEAAMRHIAGYAIAHDVSERAFQMERGGQWTKAKSCDTFSPLGPWLASDPG